MSNEYKGKRCAHCDHFDRKEGVFGACLIKQSENKENYAAFSLDKTCEYFTERTNKEIKDESISFVKHLDNAKPGPAPHMMTFGPPPSLLAALLGANPKAFQLAGCNSCSEEKEKETTGWQNPVIRRKPGRKVVPWDEVKQRMANKKQIGNTDL